MVLPIVRYGNAILRAKGSPIEKITPQIERLIADMLETMHAVRGVGLAAPQVGHALQLTVVDVTGVTDRPSTLFVEGKPAEIEAFMPLVLINPHIKPVGELVKGPEGCLSFPEIYADIMRPEAAEVKAQNAKGEAISFRCGGLLSRAVQHEIDHLNGILFIDRMEMETRRELKAELEALQAETKAARQQQR